MSEFKNCNKNQLFINKTQIDQINHEANQKAIEGIAHEVATSFDFESLTNQSVQNDDGIVLYEDFWADEDEPLKKQAI